MKRVLITTIDLFLALAMILSFCLYPASTTVNATSGVTYDQYFADYIASNSIPQQYINREHYMPYRKYVEDRKNSMVYSGLIFAWKAATFEGDIGEIADKEVAYYETILYDTLIGDISNNLVDSIDNACNSIEADVWESIYEYINEFYPEEAASVYSQIENISTDDEMFNTICYLLPDCKELENAYGFIDNVSDVADYSKKISDVVKRAAALEAIIETRNEMRQYLSDMSNATNDPALSLACSKMILILDDRFVNDDVKKMLIAGETMNVAFNKATEAVWDSVLDYALGSGLAIAAKTGQKLGKSGAGLLFSTDEDLECVFTMYALYEIDDVTVSLVKNYQENYKYSPTVENARLYNESFKQLMKIYIQGVNYSIKYEKITNEKGLVNTLFNRMNDADHKKFLSILNDVKDQYSEYLDYLNKRVYQNYLNGIPNNKAYSAKYKKNIKASTEPKMTEEEFYAYVQQSGILDQMYSNRIINGDWTLKSDTTINGDLIVKSGNVDLNGFNIIVNGDMIINSDYYDMWGYSNYSIDLNGGSLTVDGDLHQANGEIYIDNGTLNVNGNYSIENTEINNIGEVEYNDCSARVTMNHSHDKINVKGDFTTHNVCYGNICLEEGALSIAKNIWTDRGFSSGLNNRIVLNGDSTQNIYFCPDDDWGYINMLEVSNPKSRSIVFSGVLRINQLLSDINMVPEKLSIDYIDLNRKNMSVNGDIIVGYNNNEYHGIDLNGGTLSVNGNVLQKSGYVYINNGSLNVSGNYNIENTLINNVNEIEYNDAHATLHLDHQHDKVVIKGDFTTHNLQCYDTGSPNSGSGVRLYNGILNIGGNIWTDGGIYIGYTDTGNVLELSNEKDQKIFMKDSSFDCIKVLNSKNRKIVISGDLYFNKLLSDIEIISDNMNLASANLNCFNMAINNNVTIDGSGIDINGGSLTIYGDLLHKSSDVIVNNGMLKVDGNYFIENAEINNIGEKEYNECYASLKMKNKNDKVLISGDFLIHNGHGESYFFPGSYLEKGVLSVGGDIWSDRGFYCLEGHQVILNGKGRQTITIDNYEDYHISIYNLILTQPKEKYTFTNGKCWENLFYGSIANPIIESIEDPAEEPIKDPVDEPTADATEETTEDFMDEPLDDPIEEPVDILKGDINGDGKVDLTDLTMLAIILVDKQEINSEIIASADVDGDGEVSLTDLARIKQFISKKIDCL